MKQPTTILMDQRIIDSLATVSTATIAMQLLKRGLKLCYLDNVKPLHPKSQPFVAPAFTLRNIPMREDLLDMAILANPEYPQRKAIETIPSGCCLVVDAGSNATAGILGDILAERLKVRDVAAVVTDGAVRDSGELEEINLPIYSGSRAAPASIAGLFAVELQVPIGCGNVAVFPGDLMAGDKDGVLVVPRALAKEIADEAPEQERYEQFAREQISKGQSLIGIYPASDESRLDFERWDKENS